MDRSKMSDYELRKTSLSKKIGELCTKYLEENEEDSIDVHVNTVDSTLSTDRYGKSCYGRIMVISVESWKDEDDDDSDDD